MNAPAAVSVNRLAAPLVERMIAEAAVLRVAVSRCAETGATLVDAGAKARGGVEAGRRMAEICLGGLGTVSVLPGDAATGALPAVAVRAADPVIACLGSQYAGWSLGEGKFFALGSGPARALARKEPLFEELGYADAAEGTVLVLESGKPPPAAVLARVAEACGVAPERLTAVYAPTTSLAGATQVVARSLEVALHKAHALHFPLERVLDGMGVAPLPPPAPDFLTAMGRTNDAVLYGATVQLYAAGPEDEAEALAARLPSGASPAHGRPFAEIFAEADNDFYKVDPMLFSPGRVLVTAVGTGRTFARGALHAELLRRSFAFDGGG